MISPWTLAWVGWIVAFLVLEGAAIFNRTPDDTLSSQVWKWASIKGKGTAYKWRRFALLTFLAWLVAHFLTGGFF